MIIIHVMGGLGNQLYQYAMYEKLQSLGKEVKLDLYAYTDAAKDEKEWRRLELTRFEQLDFKICTQEERTAFLDNDMHWKERIRRKLLGRRNCTVTEVKSYMPELFEMDDVYLYGYWNCERYYEDRIAQLQSKLIFPKSDKEDNRHAMEEMAACSSIAVHIRRKDYLTVAEGKRYMGICTQAYYKSAMRYIGQHVENPQYYIFSDDMDYVREHYQGENIHIVDWNTQEDSFYDLQLMSCCKHIICANSTFSMWGARLNQNVDKIMIRPLHHDNFETDTVQEIHYNWKKWILIDEKGQLC